MQELKYFKGGATLVISLDGLNWLAKRTPSDKEVKKRDKELQLWISSDQMIRADEERQSVACLYILTQKGSIVPQMWKNSILGSFTKSLSLTPSAGFRYLQKEPAHPSTFTSLASSVSIYSKEALWKRIKLNMRDISGLLTDNLNMATEQITVDHQNNCIIFCHGDLPTQLFGNICQTKDCWTYERHRNRSLSSDLRSLSPNRPEQSNTDEQEEYQSQTEVRDYLQTSNPKSVLKSRNCPREPEKRNKTLKKRRSVSFFNDVTVYLFDKERPTVELHCEPSASQPSSYSDLPDVTLADSGLEWEDDFSALEKSSHFQKASHHYGLPLLTRNWSVTSKPERLFLSQTCLFLTHVTESDLDP